MTKKRGVRRLAIAMLLPYFGFWVIVVRGNWLKLKSAQESYSSAVRIEAMDFYNEQMRQANVWIDRAILWGLIVPVIVGIVALVAWWVYRGFKPKAD